MSIALSIFLLGIVLVLLSMVWDIHLSVFPHAVLAVGSVLLFGWSMKGLLAFLLPHGVGVLVLLIRGHFLSAR